MLNIRIICVGKFKEKYWEAASAEYMKRLGAYCNVSVIEVKEEKLPAHASRADEENVIIKEGKSILDKIAETSFTSSTMDFVIGGSLGLSKDVKSRAALRLSFGRITLPHQLARIVLLEQIYRAFKINAGETYHK